MKQFHKWSLPPPSLAPINVKMVTHCTASTATLLQIHLHFTTNAHQHICTKIHIHFLKIFTIHFSFQCPCTVDGLQVMGWGMEHLSVLVTLVQYYTCCENTIVVLTLQGCKLQKGASLPCLDCPAQGAYLSPKMQVRMHSQMHLIVPRTPLVGQLFQPCWLSSSSSW